MTDIRTREDLLAEIADLEEKNEILTNDLYWTEDEKQKLEAEISERQNPSQAVDAFLDELTRPCGERKFTIPDNSRVHDAIRAMADAVGRNV